MAFIVCIEPSEAGTTSDNLIINKQILNNKTITDSTRQLVVVLTKQKTSRIATVHTFEMKENTWKRVFEPIPASIGKKGFAAISEKREGDLRTPLGTYLLGTSFGYFPKINTGLKYRQTTENDFWVDDATSSSYNKWVTGKPTAKSFEILKRKDNAYKYGVVIEYNTNPIVKGMGSAIFMHVWGGFNKPTAGCVAMSESNILRLLKWLNSAMKPMIVMGIDDITENDDLLHQLTE